MTPDNTPHAPVDIIALEREARRLRAETFGRGFSALGRWLRAHLLPHGRTA